MRDHADVQLVDYNKIRFDAAMWVEETTNDESTISCG